MTQDLRSLRLKFCSEGKWKQRHVIVTDPRVETLRYRDILDAPFFWRDGDIWKAAGEPWRLFEVPGSAIPPSEQKFLADYMALVAEMATDVHGEPAQAPVCIPQLVFPLFDKERIEPHPVSVVDQIPRRRFKQHPADFAWFVLGEWRVLEIDGGSHSDDKGVIATRKRDELYKTVDARVVALNGFYTDRIPPSKMIGGLANFTPGMLGQYMELRLVHDRHPCVHDVAEGYSFRLIHDGFPREPSMRAILKMLGIDLAAALAAPDPGPHRR